MGEQTVIKINDVELLKTYLSGLSRFTDSCEFNVNSEGCNIYSINESITNRLLYWTNAITSEQEVSFALKDNINKFLNCLKTTSQYASDFDLVYDGTYLKTKKAKSSTFRLQTAERDIVADYISKPLKKGVEHLYGVRLDNAKYKEIKRMSFIDDSNQYKLYIYKKDDEIVADIDDKEQELSENITIPVQQNDENIINKDEWTETIIVSLDSFNQYNLIEAESIELYWTDKSVLDVIAKVSSGNDEEYSIEQRIISSVLVD